MHTDRIQFALATFWICLLAEVPSNLPAALVHLSRIFRINASRPVDDLGSVIHVVDQSKSVHHTSDVDIRRNVK